MELCSVWFTLIPKAVEVQLGFKCYELIAVWGKGVDTSSNLEDHYDLKGSDQCRTAPWKTLEEEEAT